MKLPRNSANKMKRTDSKSDRRNTTMIVNNVAGIHPTQTPDPGGKSANGSTLVLMLLSRTPTLSRTPPPLRILLRK